MLVRIYYAFLPETHQRPGGVWWYKTLPRAEAQDWIDAFLPVVQHLRVAFTFPEHGEMDIRPPADCRVLK